jgi:hypothetical protein
MIGPPCSMYWIVAVGRDGVLEGRKGHYQQDRFQRMQSLFIPLAVPSSAKDND